jgi:hypothetical protein
MLIGAMNHPAHRVLEEIEWMAAMGLGFIDLTLEPPLAASWNLDVRSVRAALDKRGLRAVGHTAEKVGLSTYTCRSAPATSMWSAMSAR